mgnify:CR=1 FL=1
MTNDKEVVLNPRTLEADLDQFTGTTQYFQHSLGMLYTDGIEYLAQRAGGNWLIDAVATSQPQLRRFANEFQVWELVVRDDRSAVLTVRRGSRKPAIARRKFVCTDFPLKSIKIYVRNGVMFLPSEY